MWVYLCQAVFNPTDTYYSYTILLYSTQLTVIRHLGAFGSLVSVYARSLNWYQSDALHHTIDSCYSKFIITLGDDEIKILQVRVSLHQRYKLGCGLLSKVVAPCMEPIH